MGLIGGRAIFFVAALLLLIGWAGGNGFIKWQSDSYRCFNGVGFYAAVPKQRLASFGNLHVEYQPLTWGCSEDHRYDPRVYKDQDGILVPLQPNGL